MPIEHKHYDNGYRGIVHDLTPPAEPKGDRFRTARGLGGDFDAAALQVTSIGAFPFVEGIKVTANDSHGRDKVELTLSLADASALADALATAVESAGKLKTAKLRNQPSGWDVVEPVAVAD